MQKDTSVYSKPVDTPSSDEIACDTEIGKWIELILMSPFLGIQHSGWADHVLMMRRGTPKLLSNIINKKVLLSLYHRQNLLC